LTWCQLVLAEFVDTAAVVKMAMVMILLFLVALIHYVTFVYD